MKQLFFMILIFTICSVVSAQEEGSFTDPRDEKVYKTVKIGNQTWMAENLAYKANSGCRAYNNDKSNVAKFGYLYDWVAAKAACPVGWHLPTDEEWTVLTDTLGGSDIAAGKMKTITDWEFDEEGISTNESGFNALPAGRCDASGSFNHIGSNAYFWSSTSGATDEFALGYRLYNYHSKVRRNDYYRTDYCSVRCVKDTL
jgi:uncharacterized protein (TIGR02145 family)